MGLESEKWFLKTNANGSDASGYFHIDVDAVEIMHDYVDAIHSVTQGRNALLETFEKEKKAQRLGPESVIAQRLKSYPSS